MRNSWVDQIGLFQKLSIHTIHTPSILNEQDQQLEADIMIKYMAFVWTMMIPYAWLSTSLPTDVIDIFSHNEWVTSVMQMYGIIPKEFKMNWEWYDAILWVIWIAWSIFWVQAISRWPRAARIMNKLRKMWLEKEEVTRRISQYSHNFRKRFFWDTPQPNWTQVQDIMTQAELRSGIPRRQVLENADLSDHDRLQKAEELLWPLNQDQKNTILSVHHNISKWVYQNNSRDIIHMSRVLHEAWFSSRQRRILMENGITGLKNWYLQVRERIAISSLKLSWYKGFWNKFFVSLPDKNWISEMHIIAIWELKQGLRQFKNFIMNHEYKKDKKFSQLQKIEWITCFEDAHRIMKTLRNMGANIVDEPYRPSINNRVESSLAVGYSQKGEWKKYYIILE